MKFSVYSLSLFLFAQLSWAAPVSIPNSTFETELVNRGYDSDGVVNGQMEDTDILAITNLNLANSSSITGSLDLTDFVNVTNLNISEANISSLDITTLISLDYLTLSNLPNLTSVDLSNNSAMTGFYFNNTVLTTIDLLNQPNIYAGNIYNNANLTGLKILASAGAYNTSINFGNNNPLLTCVQVDDLTVAQNKATSGFWITGGKTLSLSCPPPVAAVVMLPTSITLPQLSNSDITAIANPQPGMMTWSTDDTCVKVYNGTSWNCL
ncbi:hypothetical protein [Jiulongibacter sp. NS-SX5]|uniref:hypothetical protein n=1 Tax=Jiulongibacter sp. NS-SX5 TaxID=3463854 RepID=UPI0040591795